MSATHFPTSLEKPAPRANGDGPTLAALLSLNVAPAGPHATDFRHPHARLHRDPHDPAEYQVGVRIHGSQQPLALCRRQASIATGARRWPADVAHGIDGQSYAPFLDR